MIRRNIRKSILESLQDTPVVFIQGARQTGKSTLVRHIADTEYPADYLTLDDMGILSAAQQDPQGFLSSLSTPVILDEVQRVPELFQSIKMLVDRDRKPGRFILTGSANVLLLPRISQSLVGRIDIHTLWPFSQGEIVGIREKWIDTVFSPDPIPTLLKKRSPENFFRTVVEGGFPEVIKRKTPQRKKAWFSSYITTIVQRDIRDLSNIENLIEIPRLMSILASRTGQLLNYAEISRNTGIPQTTIKRYISMLKATMLIYTVPPWYINIGKRMVKTPKIYFCDTGLACFLSGLSLERFENACELRGRLFENFVVIELLKQISWSEKKPRLYHYRTHTQREVDIVLEDEQERVVGVEVKISATVKNEDFFGLRDFAESARERFLRGILLYTGEKVIPFGKGLYAIPLPTLWTWSNG